jgi:hypothetical protein
LVQLRDQPAQGLHQLGGHLFRLFDSNGHLARRLTADDGAR